MSQSAALTSFISRLGKTLSSGAKVVTDSDSAEFKDLLLRWSDIDKQTPSAVVLVGTEIDVAFTVKIASELDIPFVCKSGGHSLWSTVGDGGFILDLSLLKKAVVDESSRTITIQSGVLVKEATEVAYPAGLCLALGSANTSGVIPMTIGGGLNPLSALIGYGVDNIVSARMVTAEGEIVTANSTSNPDLFWAICGAGQHFGVITELTLQAYPLSILRTSDKTVWTGSIVFPSDRYKEVVEVMTPIVQDTKTPQTGLWIVSAPPPTMATCIIIIPIFFGPSDEAEKYYAPVLALNPLVANLTSVEWGKVNDSVDPFCVKGQFKRFSGAGARIFKPELWDLIMESFEELKNKCPDAGTTAYAVEWGGGELQVDGRVEKDTSYCHRDIKVWMELLAWYTEPTSHQEVSRIEKALLDSFHKVNPERSPAIYQNWTRGVPTEHRYGSKVNIDRLRELKRKWDPNGTFTKEFL